MYKISKLRKKDFTELLSYTSRDELLLPSSYDANSRNVLFEESNLLTWKKQFINRFGKEGVLIFEEGNFKIIQNDDYTDWYNKSIEGMYNWTKKYSNE